MYVSEAVGREGALDICLIKSYSSKEIGMINRPARSGPANVSTGSSLQLPSMDWRMTATGNFSGESQSLVPPAPPAPLSRACVLCFHSRGHAASKLDKYSLLSIATLVISF
jgi:hypothetical protein